MRLAPDKVDEAKAAVLEQIRKLQDELISAEVLEQAQQQKASEHVFASQTAEDIASMMARDYLSTGDPHFSQAYVDNIQKVTREQIREVARRYLVPHCLATITILPRGFESELQATTATSEPEPVRKIVLENGVRVLIRRDPTTPLVAMQAIALGGVACEDESTNGLSYLAGLLAPRRTKTRSAEEIARFFDVRGGMLDGSSGNNSIYFRSQVLKDDFPDAVEVFADVVCHPSFPESELEIFRPQVLDGIRRIDEQWRSELFHYLRGKLFDRNPYRFEPIGQEAVVAAATPEKVAGFYRDHVTGPQTVVAIYGDVDVARAEVLARRHFGDLPAGPETRLPRIDEPGPDHPKLFIKRTGPDRQVAGIAFGYHGMEIDNTDDVVPMAVMDTIISGYRLPTGWLHESLRGGDRSLVYEVHAVNQPGVLPGYFYAYAACEPGKVNEVYRIMSDQFAKAVRGEFTEAELARAKTIIDTAELLENQTNAARSMQASLDELYGMGYDYRETWRERMKAVTLDDVARVSRKYLTQPVIVVVTPDAEAVDFGIEPVAIEGEPSNETTPAGEPSHER
jgi:zinc protease